MSRLFTFGCSFTHYVWPTWADLLGLEFDEFENWGVSGIGNVGIANRVVECIVKNNVGPGDTVIIQWTSHIRHDYHLFRRSLIGRDSIINWKTKGSIFNYLNRDLYDKKWIYHFFDEKSYIMKTLNAIVSTQMILKHIGCNFAMTTIGDLEKLGSDFFEAGGFGEVRQEISLWNDFPMFLPYKEMIESANNNWIDPIGSYAWSNNEYLYSFQDPKDIEPWTDPHPSVELHLGWMTEKLKPVLELSSDLNDKQKQLVYDVAEIKKQTTLLDEFGNIIIKTLNNYDDSYRGY